MIFLPVMLGFCSLGCACTQACANLCISFMNNVIELNQSLLIKSSPPNNQCFLVTVCSTIAKTSSSSFLSFCNLLGSIEGIFWYWFRFQSNTTENLLKQGFLCWTSFMNQTSTQSKFKYKSRNTFRNEACSSWLLVSNHTQ